MNADARTQDNIIRKDDKDDRGNGVKFYPLWSGEIDLAIWSRWPPDKAFTKRSAFDL